MIVALALTLGCSPSKDTGDTADTAAVDRSFSYPLDETLRISDVQAKGTHNSYHQQPDPAVTTEWEYTHLPLDAQARDAGVRQFELDAYRTDDGFDVFHVQLIDDQSSCPTLTGCLTVLREWSDDNPAHLPLLVMIEPKAPRAMEEADYIALDEAVLAAWPAERVLAPDALQGDHATLRDAVLADGWPTLGALRGHLIVVMLDTGIHRESYTDGGTTTAGRLLFPTSGRAFGTEDPLAAFFLLDDPESEAERIAETVGAGFLVRTRADSGGVEARAGDTTRMDIAMASGAHFISTDFPAAVDGIDYVVEVPGGTPARCNPLTAPPDCTSEAVEDPQFVRW
jgi:hypothetical protein